MKNLLAIFVVSLILAGVAVVTVLKLRRRKASGNADAVSPRSSCPTEPENGPPTVACETEPQTCSSGAASSSGLQGTVCDDSIAGSAVSPPEVPVDVAYPTSVATLPAEATDIVATPKDRTPPSVEPEETTTKPYQLGARPCPTEESDGKHDEPNITEFERAKVRGADETLVARGGTLSETVPITEVSPVSADSKTKSPGTGVTQSNPETISPAESALNGDVTGSPVRTDDGAPARAKDERQDVSDQVPTTIPRLAATAEDTSEDLRGGAREEDGAVAEMEPSDDPALQANDLAVRAEKEENAPRAETSHDADEIAIEQRPLKRRPTSPLAPRTYRPTLRAPLQGRGERQARRPATIARERALRVEVRLFFKGDFCCVSLLPERDGSLPAEVEVEGDGNPPPLLALQDEWFQNVCPDLVGDILQRGLVWQARIDGQVVARWNLSGREVYVLGRRSGLSGYISIPRLLVGEEHAVLCTEGQLSSVLEALRTTGSPEPAALRSDMGVPHGWVALRGVIPYRPTPGLLEGNILDALRPLAEVEIVLDGGIRLGRATWLAGFPPNIHMRGDAGTVGQVLIDRQPAQVVSQDHLAAPKWDSPGMHEVWCSSVSKTYAIEEGPESWDAWDAYDWSLGEQGCGDLRVPAAICGVFARPHDQRARGRISVTVPSTNCLLIGAHPGEIYLCRLRSGLRVSAVVAFPWFQPIWALPPTPLVCDKASSKIILIAGSEQLGPGAASAGRGQRQAIANWCRAILDAGRKGLTVESAGSGAAKLWREYKLAARTIWRRQR